MTNSPHPKRRAVKTFRPLFLVDTNILLDVISNKDNEHTRWSMATLSECIEQGEPAINQIIYAEAALNFPTLQDAETALLDYRKLSLPWEAAFIASKAYALYKKRGGARATLMPDFYIGAHATFSRLTLVTRDRGYQNYFPTLKVISPNSR